MNSDEDDHESICAVSGVLKPPGGEIRKRIIPLSRVETNLSFLQLKDSRAGQKLGKSVLVPSS